MQTIVYYSLEDAVVGSTVHDADQCSLAGPWQVGSNHLVLDQPFPEADAARHLDRENEEGRSHQHGS